MSVLGWVLLGGAIMAVVIILWATFIEEEPDCDKDQFWFHEDKKEK